MAPLRGRTSRVTGLILLVTVAVVVACTYQRGDSPRLARPVGARPTGAPVVVGFVTQEDAPTGSFPETRRAAEAAVAHINEDLGGVGGRPLQLQTCETDGSPERSRACAQQMIAGRPVAVAGGIDLGLGAALPAYREAKIPYVTGSPQLGPELSDADSYALTGGTAAELLGAAQYLITVRHVHRVNALYVDLPGLLSAVRS